MGVDVWLLRDNDEAASPPGISGQSHNTPESSPEWSLLEGEVSVCQRCDLSTPRTRAVFGSGDVHSRLMLLGEAPGAEEDRQGLPFVGKAGKLLDAMLYAIGFSREQVFICNVLKCRPPDNRNPRPSEVEACSSYLSQQIQLIQPEVILALGRFAAHRLLATEAPDYKMRESNNYLPGTDTPVIVNYHPASLLRNPDQKAQAWEDLCKVHTLLETEES